MDGEWISVYDRLPKDGEDVAFIVDSLHDHLHGRRLGGRYTAGKFGGFSVPGITMNASYWMPLPEPPA